MTADEMRISDWSSDVCSSDLLARAERSGRMPAHIAVGVMLEVPALLFQMQALLRRVDFLSVGSNDLIQFLFASDRGNARVSNRDRTSVVCGKSVSVRVDLGGRRLLKKTKQTPHITDCT